jgi:hypothetical protein
LTQPRKSVRTQQKNCSRNAPADFNKIYSGFVEGKRENVQKRENTGLGGHQKRIKTEQQFISWDEW